MSTTHGATGPAQSEAGFYERVAALVEQLFESPTDPGCWRRMLTGFSREVGEDAVALAIAPAMPGGSSVVLGHGLGTTHVSPADLQPWIDDVRVKQAQVGEVLSIPRASSALAATNLYQNVLRPLGLAPGPGLFSVAGHDNGGLRGIALVLSRNPEWAPRPEHRTLFELLAPHLTRALSVVQQHFEHRSGTEALLGIFDSLVLGVVLLDTNREVSFANQAAAQLLGVSAGLLPPGRAGVAERKRSTAALRDLYRRETGERRGMPSYAHPIDGRPLHILSTPLRSGGPADAADARFATALFLGDPSGGAADTTVALGSLYGLTPAEERLALRLASGKTLAEAAKQLGIQLSTARGVLRAVFAKTGTRRQAGLVRLVLTLVGQVRAESPRG